MSVVLTKTAFPTSDLDLYHHQSAVAQRASFHHIHPNPDVSSMSGPWAKVSSPWGQTAVSAPVPCSLQDVMCEQQSEQLVADLVDLDTHQDAAEWEPVPDEATGTEASGGAAALSDAELAEKLAADESAVDPNDELLARYLQKEFDEEYDKMVAQSEKKFNGSSKVSISFQNYKMRHRRESEGTQLVEDIESEEEEPEVPEQESPSKWETERLTVGAKGYSGSGKNIVTKHDKVICGRRNAERLMDVDPGFAVGDGEGMDMQLSNQVFNKLKKHTKSETKRSQRVHEKKDHSTAIKAVDEKTRILLYKFINSGYLASIGGEVSQGKEAVILQGQGGMTVDEHPLPADIILKVYKTTMTDFHTRAKYVYGDHVLSKDMLKKQNPRKIIKIWAEKEFLNLKRMRRARLPCPSPLILRKNVLLMTCIGGENPAPKLKDIRLSTVDAQDAFEQVVELMKAMYHKCGLVHADMSEYNLLWHEGRVWVIDVSQSVEIENSNSYEFLLRDCKNISNFFSQSGVHGVPTPEDLFMQITNMSMEGTEKVFTSQAQRYYKDNYSFDYFFDQSEEKRAQGLLSDSSESEGEDEEELEQTCSGHVGEKDGKSTSDQSGNAPSTSQESPASTGRWIVTS